ncbi:GNAT family N-acetyltransferase [Lutibacter holmesii]|uniref:GNAT family N-acetyltransferase n=1 Tax=Lutibacter holmesii TaxID=1137985 RepID=A0ABW3WQT9_9FLAO
MRENSVKILGKDYLGQILQLTKQLNPTLTSSELESRQLQMFEFENYTCFGLFEDEVLIGVASGWITVRLYSDRQLEIDNFVIDSDLQSNGYGKLFITEIELWAKANNCKTVELNTYVQNDRSHKFYFNKGYRILGFHFQKKF